MESVTILGTSAGTPTKTRNVSSAALRLENGRILLVDCGEGTQHQLLRAPSASASRVDAVLLTHAHGDHTFGLPGLLASISLTSQQQREFVVVGPQGTKAFVDAALAFSCTHLTYALRVVELLPGETRTDLAAVLNCSAALAAVEAHPIVHAQGVPCFGYVFREHQRPGTLDARRAAALGARGAQLGQLKSGREITVAETGAVVRPADVLGPPRRGRVVAVLGDTCDCSALKAAVAGCCDLAVHEATFGAGEEDAAREGGHSTSTMAGAFAAAVGARALVLTHFSQRYTQQEGAVSTADLAAQAQAAAGSGCNVVAADDFAVMQIPKLL